MSSRQIPDICCGAGVDFPVVTRPQDTAGWLAGWLVGPSWLVGHNRLAGETQLAGWWVLAFLQDLASWLVGHFWLAGGTQLVGRSQLTDKTQLAGGWENTRTLGERREG